MKCAGAEVKESEEISMPDSYDSICTMIEMREGEDTLLDFVKKELLEFELRRNQKKGDKKNKKEMNMFQQHLLVIEI